MLLSAKLQNKRVKTAILCKNVKIFRKKFVRKTENVYFCDNISLLLQKQHRQKDCF